MAKIEVKTYSKPHRTSERLKHYCSVSIDGVIFETECQGPDSAMDLALRTAKALGVGYQKV